MLLHHYLLSLECSGPCINPSNKKKYQWESYNMFSQLKLSIWLLFSLQTTDDILVASAECPSDDEDIDPCEPSSGGLG